MWSRGFEAGRIVLITAACLQYDDHVDVEGVKLPRHWTFFWSWSADRGGLGEPIGHVKLSNLAFVTPGPNAFLKPEGSSEDALPGS